MLRADEDTLIDIQCHLEYIPRPTELPYDKWHEWCKARGFNMYPGDEATSHGEGRAWCHHLGISLMKSHIYILASPWGHMLSLLTEDEYQDLRKQEEAIHA